jgi:ProP effector
MTPSSSDADIVTLSAPPGPDQPVATTPEAAAATSSPTDDREARIQSTQAVLEKLFELYPHLFGAQFLPLKLGIFQELLARHPDAFTKEGLKAALGVHARSTRYLQSVAAGNLRHDLDGAAVEPVAPEHRYVSLLELFRRRQKQNQNRAREDLRPKFRAQLIAAFIASGLSRQDYVACVQNGDVEATKLLEEALAEHAETIAKQAALRRAFESSGKSPAEFADMYGMRVQDVTAAIAATAA